MNRILRFIVVPLGVTLVMFLFFGRLISIIGVPRIPFAGVLMSLMAGGISLWLIIRYGWLSGGASRSGPMPLPASASGPDWSSRIAESVALALAGGALLILIGTYVKAGGGLLYLGQMSAEHAGPHVIAALIALMGWLVAVLMALFWRTWAAVLLMLVAVVGYLWILNVPNGILGSSYYPHTYKNTTLYHVIKLDRPIEGAQLYVNGVHLGKMPVLMLMDDFLEKVPYWPEPPEGYTKNKAELEEIETPHWMRISLPKQVAGYGPKYSWINTGNGAEAIHYYVQVKLGDEWASGRDSYSGVGGQGKNNFVHTLSNTIFANFPKRQHEWKDLLVRAHLGGAEYVEYEVDDEWFAEADVYGSFLWKVLQSIHGSSTPQMRSVRDAWVSWKYQLGKVHDAETAWEVFERICRDADRHGNYDTNSPAGRAVELLIPYLDPAKLMKQAWRRMKSEVAVA